MYGAHVFDFIQCYEVLLHAALISLYHTWGVCSEEGGKKEMERGGARNVLYVVDVAVMAAAVTARCVHARAHSTRTRQLCQCVHARAHSSRTRQCVLASL